MSTIFFGNCPDIFPARSGVFTCLKTDVLRDVSNKMERVNGIEPSYPAWKAGALTVVLHPLVSLIRGYFDPALIPSLGQGEDREGSKNGDEGRILRLCNYKNNAMRRIRRRPALKPSIRWRTSLFGSHPYKSGGEGRIRTSEGFADRFTVCSLWPLGNLTTLLQHTITLWSHRRDLNPRPAVYKTAALPAELRWPFGFLKRL